MRPLALLAALVLLFALACAPMRRVKNFVLSSPDPACEQEQLCKRYGWCSGYQRMVIVGTDTEAVKDYRLGAKSDWVCFGDDTNPFHCPYMK